MLHGEALGLLLGAVGLGAVYGLEPGHAPNESSPGVSPVASECGLEPKGWDRPNPMVDSRVFRRGRRSPFWGRDPSTDD